MDTSNYNDIGTRCIGGAYVFSGRPDPTWNVGIEAASRLFMIWSGLKRTEISERPPSILGYRGCYLSCEKNKTWFAYRGRVTLVIENKKETRLDDQNEFEKTLLGTAPKEIMPMEMIPKELWE